MRFRKVISIVIIIPIILILLVFTAFHIPPIQRTAVSIVLSKLNQKLPFYIELDDLYLSIITGDLSVRHARLLSSKDEAEGVIARLDSLKAKVRLLPLLKGKVLLSNINIKKPLCNLEVWKGGKTSFNPYYKQKPKKKKRSKPKKTPEQILSIFFDRIIFEHVQLEDGDFNLTVHQAEFELGVTTFNIDINFNEHKGCYCVSLDCPKTSLSIGTQFAVSASISSPSFYWTRTGAEISKLELKLEDGDTDLQIRDVVMKGYDPPILNGYLDSSIDLSDLSKLIEINIPLSGKPNLLAHFEGPADDMNIEIKINSERLLIWKAVVQKLNLEAIYNNLSLNIPSVDVDIAGGRVTGDTFLEFKQPEQGLKGTISISEVNYHQLTEMLEIPYKSDSTIAAKCNFSMQAFKPDNLSVSGDMHIRGWFPDKIPFLAKADLDFENNLFKVQNFKLLSRDMTISLDGNFSTKATLDLQARLNVKNLEKIAELSNSILGDLAHQGLVELDVKKAHEIIPASAMKGKFTLDVEVSGSFSNPAIEAKLYLKDGEIFSIPCEELKAQISMIDRIIELSEFHYKEAESEIFCEGNLSLKEEKAREKVPQKEGIYFTKFESIFKDIPPLEAKLNFTQVDVDKLFSGLSPFIKGAGSIDGSASLSTYYNNLSGFIEIKGGEGNILGQRYESIDLNLCFDSTDITLNNFNIGIENEMIYTKGVLADDDSFDIDLKTPVLSTTLFDILKDKDLPVKSNFKLSIEGHGSLKSPVLNVILDIPSAEFEDRSLGAGRVTAVLDQDGLEADLSAFDNRLEAHTTLQNSPGYPFEITMAMSNLELSPIIATITNDKSPIAGHLSGNAFYNGELVDFMASHGGVEINDLNIGLQGVKLNNNGPLKATINENRVTIDSFDLISDGMGLKVTGGIALPDSLDLKLDGSANLALLPGFIPAIMWAEGKADLNALAGGTFSNPSLVGEVNIDGKNIRIAGSPGSLSELTGQILLSIDQITLKNISGKLGGGSLNMDGSLYLKNFAPSNMDFEITAEDINLKIPKGVYTNFSGSMKLSGGIEEPLIDGIINLHRLRIVNDYDLDVLLGENVANLILKKKVREFQPKAYEETGFNPRLNIRVFAPDTIYIDNNLAKLQMSADIEARGGLQKPLLFGRISADKGLVFFQDQEFKLISAIIDFLDPAKIDPFIDVNAEAKIQEYLITINISGTPSTSFSLRTSSEPPVDELSIYSLIGFGKTKEQLMETGGDTAANQAAILLSSMLTAQLERRAQMIGLDRFQIEPNISSDEKKSSTKFTVGKKITEDLYVLYTGEISGSESQLVVVEYKIADNVLLVGERDQDNVYGGDLKFRFEFR